MIPTPFCEQEMITQDMIRTLLTSLKTKLKIITQKKGPLLTSLHDHPGDESPCSSRAAIRRRLS